MKISVSMITLNEEKNIARAISSCSFADEIVVVDGGSADRTLDILRSNDKVLLIQHPWENHFGRQRQMSLDHCSGEWVIRLDADEAFPEEFEEGIRKLLSATHADIDGYFIRQCNLVGNEKFYSKRFDDYEAIPRIWRRRPQIRWGRHINETITGLNDNLRPWDVYVVHYGFLDRKRYWQKGVNYSQIPESGVYNVDPGKFYYREYDIQPRPPRSAVAGRVPECNEEEDPSGLPEIAIIRATEISETELLNYESLAAGFNLTLYTTETTNLAPAGIKLPVIKLPLDMDKKVFLQGLEFVLFDKDIIYSVDCSLLYNAQAAIAKHKFGKKMIMLERGNPSSLCESNESERQMKHFIRESVDVFIAVSESAKEVLLSEGAPEDRTVVIDMDTAVSPEETNTGLALLFDRVFQSTFKGSLHELAEYTHLTAKEIMKRVRSVYSQQVQEWKGLMIEKPTRDKVQEFYRSTDSYLFDLVQYNYENTYYIKWTEDIFNFCAKLKKQRGALKILDFGGGIGSQLISLSAVKGAELSYADIPGRTFEYAGWRFNRRHLDIDMIDATGGDFLQDRMYDVVITLDVIEHLVNPEATAEYLIGHIKPDGYLITVTSFVDNNGEAGWHLNVDRYTDEVFYDFIKASGMEMLNAGRLPRYFRKSPEDPDDLKPRIYSAISEERLADAKSLMEAHLEMHLLDLCILVKHAEVCLKLGDCRSALESIEKVLLFRPDMPEAVKVAEEIKRGDNENTSCK